MDCARTPNSLFKLPVKLPFVNSSVKVLDPDSTRCIAIATSLAFLEASFSCFFLAAANLASCLTVSVLGPNPKNAKVFLMAFNGPSSSPNASANLIPIAATPTKTPTSTPSGPPKTIKPPAKMPRAIVTLFATSLFADATAVSPAFATLPCSIAFLAFSCTPVKESTALVKAKAAIPPAANPAINGPDLATN